MPTGPARRSQANMGLSASRPVDDVNARVDSPLSVSTLGMPADLTLLVLALPEGQAQDLIKEIQNNKSVNNLSIAILRMQSQSMAGVLGLMKASCSDPAADTQAPPDQFDNPVEVGKFVLDPSSYRVSRAGKPASFTTLEFRLLYYLAARPNRLFTRKQLFQAVFSGGRSMNPRIVDVYVRRIRVKLEADPEHPIHLKTSRGVGYFVDPSIESPYDPE